MTSPPRTSRWRRVAIRWRPLAALAVALPIASLAVVGTRAFPGRPFPGFFVLCNGVVPTVGLFDWTGLQAGVRFHSRLVAIDDRPVRDPAEVYEHAASLPIGTPVQYTFEKDDRRTTIAVPTMRFGARDYLLTVGLWLLNGLLLVAVGVTIGALQPHTRAARVFLLFGVVTGLCALTGAALYHPSSWAISALHLVLQAFFPATFIHCGLVFPEERLVVRRHPALLWIPYAVATVLALWAIVDYFATPPRMTALYPTYVYTAVSILLWIGLAAYAYWENRTPIVRPRLRPVLVGLSLGTVIALFGFLNIAASGGDFPLNLIALTPWLFYLSIGYAIVRHDLFDIDVLLKQTVVYLMLTLAITVAYVASTAALGTLLPPQAVRASPLFNVAFVVLVASLFHPLRTRVQHAIDRTFYRNRLDYRRTVVEVSAALTSLLDLGEILERITRTLTEGLQIRALTVVLWPDDGTELWRWTPAEGRMVRSDGPAYGALRQQLATAPRRSSTLAQLDGDVELSPDGMGVSHAARDELHDLRATLAVPLSVGNVVIGAFALGPRLSGRSFTRDDLELLATLADESAVAIQNARSYRALQTLNASLETRIGARTAELERSNAEVERAYADLQAAQSQLLLTEKMASLGLVVAGVAHEINNPVSFIIGNVEPLQATLAEVSHLAATHRDPRLQDEVQRLAKILDLMALGAERTAAIVQDLRTFSRLGESQPRPTDVHEAIEVSLRLLRPRWGDRIEILRDYGDLPAIEAIPGQINQVLMNVLANACDAIRGPGTVWIATAVHGLDAVVTIRDSGTGIPAGVVARIFDPFFTTKAVGQGTGLGLAIAHGIVSHHGGTIRVTTESGVGTQFRIALPIAGTAKLESAIPRASSSAGGGSA